MPTAAATILDGRRAGAGASTLAVDLRRVGTGTGTFFAGLDVDVDDRLVATTGGDVGASTDAGAGAGVRDFGTDGAPEKSTLASCMAASAAAIMVGPVLASDGAIDFGPAGGLIEAAPDVARVMAAANAGVGAIEVGRGGRLVLADALLLVSETTGAGAADFGRGSCFGCAAAKTFAAAIAGVGAADVGRGGRFVDDDTARCCGHDSSRPLVPAVSASLCEATAANKCSTPQVREPTSAVASATGGV